MVHACCPAPSLLRWLGFKERTKLSFSRNQGKGTASARTGHLTLENTEEFVRKGNEKLAGTSSGFQYSSVIDASFPAHAIINFDETLMTVHDSKIVMVKMTDSIRKASTNQAMRLNTIGSLTPFVNAAGEVILKVYCLKTTTVTPKVNVLLDNKGDDYNVWTCLYIVSFSYHHFPIASP